MTDPRTPPDWFNRVPIYESKFVPDGQMYRTPMGLFASAATIASLYAALTPQRDRFWLAAGIMLALVVLLAVIAIVVGGQR